MVNTIEFKNYKIFKDKQRLELAPLTVLIGKNNVGKSAVLRLPLIVEAGLAAENPQPVSISVGDIDLGGELRDLVYGKANRTLDISLEYDISNDNPEHLDLGILITQDKSRSFSKIDFWKLNNELALRYEGSSNTYIDEISDTKYVCEFNGFRLDSYFEKKSTAIGTLPKQRATLPTDYIGPVRKIADRDYRIQSTDGKHGQYGENAYQFLIEDALTTERNLVKAVSNWYSENFEGWGIRVNQDRNPVFQIEVERNEIRQNIRDAGMGMGQALPLVVRALKSCENNTLIIIEEPESHLHPGAHGNLAKLFVDSLSDRNKRYLIETHSQNFILRIRRMVAEGLLDRNRLKIYYVDFDEDKNQSHLDEIRVGDDGSVDKWPENIFSEALTETIAIRTAQIEKENVSRDKR